MKKILLLATGGTIASSPGEDGLAPAYTDQDLLNCIPQMDHPCTIDGKLLMSIDSTNMQPEYWAEIARAVYENYRDYDGFVITHGTDTLAYTAAALSYMLQNLSKPVVVTGSMYPIKTEQSDAEKNIADAVRFACEDTGGVYIVFDGKVIMGTRAVKVRTKSHNAFESINSPYAATIEGSQVNYSGDVYRTGAGDPKLDTSLCTDVFLLKLHPGVKPELFDHLKALYKGVIIESFGNGGIPFHKRNLIPKIKKLIDAGIAVVITTQCLQEGTNLDIYEVGRKVSKNLIICPHDMNTEAIVPKLMWALGKTDKLEEIKEIMETPVSGDIRI